VRVLLYQGSGLGLFIAKHLAELHHGSLIALSAGEDQGAEFILKLPVFVLRADESDDLLSIQGARSLDLCNAESKIVDGKDIEMGIGFSVADDDEAIKTSVYRELDRSDSSSCVLSTKSKSVVNLAKLNVLIVDDVQSTRKIVDRMLRGKIFQSFQAKDGQECLDLVTSGAHRIDIILLDFEMPVMNGPDAATRLRSAGFTLPIIGVTGNALPEDRAHFIRAGADTVMTKPVNVGSLIACLKDIFK
jgi:CheY-like chemotaxis protein